MLDAKAGQRDAEPVVFGPTRAAAVTGSARGVRSVVNNLIVPTSKPCQTPRNLIARAQ